MEERLKQRLVGATVLVALAVIFVPMLLDGVQENGLNGNGAIPPRAEQRVEEPAPDEYPAIPALVEVQGTDKEATPVAEPARLPADAGAQGGRVLQGTPAAVKPAAPPRNDVKPEPLATARPLPAREMPRAATPPAAPAPGLSAWVVQMASFSREDNALALRDRLRAAGYTAFIERLRQPGGDSYRVRVGPEVERSRAEAVRERLEKEMKLKGFVQQYP